MKPMLQWVKNKIHQWHAAKTSQAQEHLALLKARYQLFRAILQLNGRAIELITELDMRLRETDASYEDIANRIDELLSVTFGMVEKLNDLTDNGYEILFTRHELISKAIKEWMEQAPRQKDLPDCVPLKQIEPHAARLFGNKALVLANLMKTGDFHIPEGFAIPVHACRRFLDENGLTFRIIQKLGRYARQDRSGYTEVPHPVFDAIKDEIISAPLPKELEGCIVAQARPFFEAGHGLAVRSSAIGEDGKKYSFAGQFATILNVKTESGLIAAVKNVIASNFSPRSIAYRINAGIEPLDFNMSVLCVQMVPAVAAGILFTIDPNDSDSGRMLISAVFGLGELAVAGESNADIYRPLRQPIKGDTMPCVIAKKGKRLILDPKGGVAMEDIPEQEQTQPVLTEKDIETLVRLALEIESLAQTPQDIEWAKDSSGELFILQARPLRFFASQASFNGGSSKDILFTQGVTASRGTATGMVFIVKNRQDLDNIPAEPVILVLHQSLVDAAKVMSRVQGVLVDLGNPADHLSCVAREHSRPMLTGLQTATTTLKNGQWITLDADTHRVFVADEAEITAARSAMLKSMSVLKETAPEEKTSVLPEFQNELTRLIVTLNLTDAYGPTFSMLECKSLHDIVRFVHEKSVLSIFDTSDDLLANTTGAVFTLESGIPFFVHVVDLGGGLVPKEHRWLKVRPDEIVSTPFKALWQGISTPGLRWSSPPPGVSDISQTYSRWVADARSERPIGLPNYAMISRDYLNLNARMDFHFVMIDTVCGSTPQANYIKFRFKGGGTNLIQRRRRAGFIAELLERNDFFVDWKDDLINGEINGVDQSSVQEKLVFLGRLLGFTRLLDMAMTSDSSAAEVARAFMEGDYELRSLKGTAS